jgi:hypothetical protein
MLGQALAQKLAQWTAENGGFEPRRDYIGLSGVWECPRVMVSRYRDGMGASQAERMRTAVAYELEHALQARLSGMGIYRPGKEISLFDGLVRGHTDGEVDGDLLEIKTIPEERWLPGPTTGKRMAERIYWQVQAYLLYGEYERAQVVFLARDSGAISVVTILPNRYTQEAIERKLEKLVGEIRAGQAVSCTCGKCRDARG